jgi:hypothetical protein
MVRKNWSILSISYWENRQKQSSIVHNRNGWKLPVTNKKEKKKSKKAEK